MPGIVGVTVGPVRTGVAVIDRVTVGVTVERAGDGVTGARVGTTTKGVKLGSRPALGALRDTSHNSTMTSPDAIDAMRAPKNPRRVLAAACEELSAIEHRSREHGTSRRHWNLFPNDLSAYED